MIIININDDDQYKQYCALICCDLIPLRCCYHE